MIWVHLFHLYCLSCFKDSWALNCDLQYGIFSVLRFTPFIFLLFCRCFIVSLVHRTLVGVLSKSYECFSFGHHVLLLVLISYARHICLHRQTWLHKDLLGGQFRSSTSNHFWSKTPCMECPFIVWGVNAIRHLYMADNSVKVFFKWIVWCVFLAYEMEGVFLEQK